MPGFFHPQKCISQVYLMLIKELDCSAYAMTEKGRVENIKGVTGKDFFGEENRTRLDIKHSFFSC